MCAWSKWAETSPETGPSFMCIEKYRHCSHIHRNLFEAYACEQPFIRFLFDFHPSSRPVQCQMRSYLWLGRESANAFGIHVHEKSSTWTDDDIPQAASQPTHRRRYWNWQSPIPWPSSQWCSPVFQIEEIEMMNSPSWKIRFGNGSLLLFIDHHL